MFSTCIYTGGNLAIGSKETISWCKSAKAYHVESLEEKVYKKIAE
jgi:chemotaxis methyl-accepting protein methylase